MHERKRIPGPDSSRRSGCLAVVGLITLGLVLVLGSPPAHAAQLTVSWSDATPDDHTGFKVERKTGTAGAFAQVATTGPTVMSYIDTTLTAGTTYCYRARAYNAVGDSPYTSEACAAAPTAVLRTLTVAKSGTGTGTVDTSPAGISCGTTCSATYPSGTSVALSATPAAGATFTGWSGACSGTSGCAVVLDANKSATATFSLSTQTTYALIVSKSGTGSGTVTSTPAGITCGSTCSATYSSGTSVTLTAAAATGSTFTGWSGACSGTGSCVVSLTAARSATATFALSTPTTSPPAVTGQSIFPATAVPANSAVNDSNAVELGMKFQASVQGTITGIRFYKGSTNTGTHVGNLWTNTGTLLGTVTFTNETASGWQQATLASPVTIQANTTYVVSYHTTVGRYAANAAYFGSALVTGPLTAPASGSIGGNGVYVYGAGGFPRQSYNASNYWVDIVFTTSDTASDNTPPAVTGRSPAPGATGVATTPTVTATFSKALAPATVTTSTVTLQGPGTTSVPATVSYNSTTFTATLAPSSPLAGNTTYTVTVKGGTTDPRVKDVAGNALASNVSWTFTTATTTITTATLFPANAVPATITDPDASAVELGMKFQSKSAGKVTGIRFYKGPSNTGTHVGSLWSSSGQLLGTVTFTNETSSGWQQANFATPVTIAANTTYVVSYHTNAGHYSANNNYFGSSVINGPLTALADGAVGGNGLYRYGAGGFPNQTWKATNYWVDVVFQP